MREASGVPFLRQDEAWESNPNSAGTRDCGAWWAAFYGVAQSRTRLKRLSSSSMQSWDWILRPRLVWGRELRLPLSLFKCKYSVQLFLTQNSLGPRRFEQSDSERKCFQSTNMPYSINVIFLNCYIWRYLIIETLLLSPLYFHCIR